MNHAFILLLKFLDLGVLLGQENVWLGLGQLLIAWNCLCVLDGKSKGIRS